jgi:hypothetical protein
LERLAILPSVSICFPRISVLSLEAARINVGDELGE